MEMWKCLRDCASAIVDTIPSVAEQYVQFHIATYAQQSSINAQTRCEMYPLEKHAMIIDQRPHQCETSPAVEHTQSSSIHGGTPCQTSFPRLVNTLNAQSQHARDFPMSLSLHAHICSSPSSGYVRNISFLFNSTTHQEWQLIFVFFLAM